MAVANTESKLRSVDSLIERHHTEEIFAVFTDSVFFGSNGDMAEAQSFFQAVDDFYMRNHLVSEG